MMILLVDDHVFIREALRAVVTELLPDADVLEASNGRQALRMVEEHEEDMHLVLLDLRLPDRDGMAILTELRQRFAAVSVVILSAHSERDLVLRALDLGAFGFIPKSAPREVIVNALRLVVAGGVYVPLEALALSSGKSASIPVKKGSPSDFGLTDRQLEVLAYMMQGKSNKWICRTLNVAEPTVKHHVTAVLKALDVSNRTEAVVAVTALGWDLTNIRK
jgi:DNA-binding NarL/FixJ family response regulator